VVGKTCVKMKPLIALLLCTLFFSANAQQKQEILNYIDRYKQVAIDEMVRSKVPASITIAQGILESSAGTSTLSRNSNNHFGIKCKEEWSGKKYYHDDDKPQECFRVYENVRESFADHSDFLLTRPRYAPLFNLPITSYKYWALGLKEAGYATNPKYASIVIAYIEDYKLFELDETGVALIEEREKMLKQPVITETLTAHAPKNISATEAKNNIAHKQIVTEAKNAETGRLEFVINGVRAIKAIANEDPFKIAYEYNIDYSFIMSYNDMNTGDRFKDGEFVFLQNKKARGANANYTVQTGESMRDIAQKTGIKMRDLYSKNAMRMNDQPYAGENLALQEKISEAPLTMTYYEYLKALSKASQTNGTEAQNTYASSGADVPNLPTKNISINTGEYQVQKSDTLYSIAKKFNTSIEHLKSINNLENAELRAGQTLVVAQ